MPIGERPIAPGHHRFDWLYVTAFVSPATGETFWYVHDGVSKPFFEALLKTFAREAGAGLHRTIILVLDNAGWHGEAGLNIPEGVRLVFLRPIEVSARFVIFCTALLSTKDSDGRLDGDATLASSTHLATRCSLKDLW